MIAAVLDRTRAAAAVALAVLVVACVPAAALPSGTPAASPSVATPSVPAPSSAAPAPASADATPQQPPAAALTIGSRPAVAGSIGTYVFAGAGSDAPWLPGVALPVGNGGNAVVRLVPDVGSGAWHVKRAAADDKDGSTARTIASGSGLIAFKVDAVAATIMLDVEYTGGQGNGTYFWRVTPG
ncbi:MAG: hypothetical protein ACJ77B_06125 [Chloroflexota bacterium]